MEEGSPSRGAWPAAIEEALESGSPSRFLEALGNGLGGASKATSRRSWAELDGEALPPPCEFFAGSLGLLWELLDCEPGERVALSDSVDLSESEPSPSPTPDGKGKQEAVSDRKRRRVRHHRRWSRPEGFMAAARRSHPSPPPSTARAHPTSVLGRDLGSPPLPPFS